MVGLYDAISEIGKVELAVMNSLHISYLLSSPLVFITEVWNHCSYQSALGKTSYYKNICLETLQIRPRAIKST